ncbi:hypothetical protein ASPZODRAFT_137485 [Penicilliopsis zonata CBS 506.65]|uniref:Uncharacterized protein n=1 Tax=Penicilliopsis zonata CBS 506.65 TaxID=1073090 RepID=A0A1L9S4K8_9EURO|nr:hypothetical protein ASPZODRAFT_137485 [Penicilliopsis zonata CBS 506.65]OJJ42095.1 hypothetical protein ASPZODRAFT_137485 [Penicilliopsis zonata CBS 506.65]
MESLVNIINNGSFPSLDDASLIQLLYQAFASEIDRLKRVPPRHEGDGSPPRGSLGAEGLTPSRLLFGEDFCEVNRSITNILAVRWVLADQYDALTLGQSPTLRLSRDTFCAFQAYAQPILAHPEQCLALVVALIVGDMGKDPQMEDDVAAKREGKEPGNRNHDELLAHAVAVGLLDAPLGILPAPQRRDVILGIDVGATLNIPQLMQGENVPGSLQCILRFQDNPSAFHLKYLEILFDVAGSAAHLDARGAVSMIEPVCRSILQALPILEEVIAGRTSLRQAYDHVLQNRGQMLAAKGFSSLSTDSPSDRALLRVLAMGRVADPLLAEQFQDAFYSLPDATRSALVHGLNADGCEDEPAVVLYYMPSVFVEALRVLHDAQRQTRQTALHSLMGFMARTLQVSLDGGDWIVERDVSPVREIVASPAFCQDPHILDDYVLEQ